MKILTSQISFKELKKIKEAEGKGEVEISLKDILFAKLISTAHPMCPIEIEVIDKSLLVNALYELVLLSKSGVIEANTELKFSYNKDRNLVCYADCEQVYVIRNNDVIEVDEDLEAYFWRDVYSLINK